MRLVITLFLFFIATNFCSGRGFYEIKFTLNNGQEPVYYKGLLLFFDDNSPLNKMRIVYYDNGKKVVVEENIKIEYTKSLGRKFRIIKGYDPVIIYNGTNNKVYYYPDSFIFKKGNDGFFKPHYVKSTLPVEGVEIGSITSYTALNQTSIEYLSEFNWNVNKRIETDSPKSYIRRLQPKSVASSLKNYRSQEPKYLVAPFHVTSKIHLVLISNTKVNDLGKSCVENESQLENFFSSASEVSGVPVNIIKINSMDFRLFKVDSIIKSLSITQDDGVFFYYSGHGYRYPNEMDSFPILDFRINPLSERIDSFKNVQKLSSFYNLLKLKKPRFLVAISESCNKEIQDRFVLRSDKEVSLAPSNIPLDSGLVTRLFNFTGEVVVATAMPQQNSYYYPRDGGIFCGELLDALISRLCRANDDSAVLWSEILKVASDNTLRVARSKGQDYKQQAYWKIY
jgi:hypothetical protein